MAKRDGTFTLKRDIRSPDPDGPLVLEARQWGYETGRTTEGVSWGDEHVNIACRSGLAVEIVVQDGETGEPVEDFSVRCFSDPASASRHTDREYRLLERGHHPGGVLRLEGQTCRPRYVIVHPTDAGYGHSACRAITVTDAGAPRQTIPVFHREPARIKVVRPDGTPVAGTHLLKATVLGRVELNGKPAAGVWIGLDGRVALRDGRTDDVSVQGLSTDEGGHFAAKVWPGEHRLLVQAEIDGEHVYVRSADAFQVRPGESVTRSFSITTGTLEVRVFHSDGAMPAKGVRLHLYRPAPVWPSRSGTTDADGRARFAHLGCGAVEVLAVPKDLIEFEALQAFLHREGKRLEDVLVPLGSVTVSPGGNEARFILPATAGYWCPGPEVRSGFLLVGA